MEEFFEEEKQRNIMRIQQKKLIRILKLNASKHEEHAELQQFTQLFVWKVLIYDSHAKNVITSLLKVGNMRSYNVTLFLDLESKREAIRDVAAVYLIKPCKESIDHVIEDLNGKLYDYAFINFISPCPEPLLENFAVECGRYNNQARVLQVYEHYLNYFSITSNMFTLNLPDAYLSLYRNYEIEEGIESHLNMIAEGIFMFMRSSSFFPYIRFQKKDYFAERISKKLCELFAKTEKSEEEKYDLTESSRPLLVLLDRSMDIQSLLHHPWKYIALVHDVFGINNGKVVGPSDKGKKVEYELDFLNDGFLQTHALSEYPEAAGDISAEFNKWTKEYEGMIGKKPGEEAKGSADVSSKLNEALDQVPEMTERKIRLEAHTNLTTFLYDHVKKRGLDQLNDLELQIMTSKSVSSKVCFLSYFTITQQLRSELVALLSTKPVSSQMAPDAPVKPVEDDPIFKKGGLDRLRLLLIYLLTSEKVRADDIEELKNILAANYPDLSLDSLAYLRGRSAAATSDQEESHGGLSRIFTSNFQFSNKNIGVAKSGLSMFKEFLSADKVYYQSPYQSSIQSHSKWQK
eukprot:TRINITY_DN88026_c2_g1_i1.p2 TRINITY_DN88026_c2_g1~~TRINITY_DN88026_c2_g1_i1.p2  ORF type:complete len:574 (+),score=68.37 TRINITY_DN88026_c2_g1_i1:6275-7996(+)